MRCFLAINLPQDIKAQISQLILELRRFNSSPAFRWVKPENIHLTLHFFGELNQDQTQQLVERLTNLFSKHKTFSLQSSGLGCFPNQYQPRVLFLALQNNQELYKMIQNLRKLLFEMSPCGGSPVGGNFEIDPRPFQSHLTLARLKDSASCRTNKVASPELSFEVKSVELMKSELRREGPIYSVIKSFPLSL